MKLQESISGNIPSSPITVYHGSSSPNLKIKPNSIMWFTADKDDAEEWANRTVLGGKETPENYIYTAEITFNKPYIIGDDKANPAYAKFEDSDDKMDIYTELFFDDVEEKEKFISQGYDCFIDNLLFAPTFGIPSQFKKNIKFIKKERVADSEIIDENSSNDRIDNTWNNFVAKIGKRYLFDNYLYWKKHDIAVKITDIGSVYITRPNDIKRRAFSQAKTFDEIYNTLKQHKLLPDSLNENSEKELSESIVAYHGSPNVFKKFDKAQLGSSTKKFEDDDYTSTNYGFFFTDDEEYASGYGDNIYKCDIQLNNPLVVDMSEYIATEENLAKFLQQAKDENKDGVIFKNIREIGRNPTTEYVVFNSDNVKIVDNIEETVVYHGSDADFDVFDMDKIGQKYGCDHGYGLYFTTDTKYTKQFIKNNQIYEVEIIPADETFMKEEVALKNQSQYVKEHIANLLSGESDNYSINYEKVNKADVNGYDFYDNILIYKFNHDKKLTSELFYKYGISGIIYFDNGVKNYVVFNNSDVRIIKKISLSESVNKLESIVAYHGSQNDNLTPDFSRGFYLTNNKEMAIDFAKGYLFNYELADNETPTLYTYEVSFANPYIVKSEEEYEAHFTDRDVSEIITPLKQAGYDGIIIPEFETGCKYYVVFDDTKSVKLINKESIPEEEWIYESVDEILKEDKSNLNDAFWSWFGNSKVIDNNGNPLIVYHGSKAKFDTFDKTFSQGGTWGVGIYFGTDAYKNFYNGGNMYKAYLSIQKPFVVNSQQEYRAITDDAWDLYNKQIEDGVIDPFDDCLLYDDYISNWYLEEIGYDGIIAGKGIDTEYVVFRANQIKSVDNAGTWNSETANIYENTISQPIIAYHLSKKDFDNFSLDYIHSGLGSSLNGYGIYFTKDISIIEEYLKKLNDNEYFIYTVTLDGNIIKGDDNGWELYSELVDKHGDEKLASLGMVKNYNIDGISYYNPEDGNSFTVFNPNIVKIIKKERVVDSKLLNESALDLLNEEKHNYGILYHGTDEEFDNFSKESIVGGYLGKGFYFTMSPTMAKSYGKNIIKAKLNYNNSFMFDTDTLDNESLCKILDTSTADKETKNRLFQQYIQSVNNNAKFDANNRLFDVMDYYNGDTTSVLKELGYDSIDNIDRDSEFLVFEPNQIEIVKEDSLMETVYPYSYHFNESALDLDPEELYKNREEDRELEKLSFQTPKKPMSKELRELLYGKKSDIQKSSQKSSQKTTQKTTQKISSKNNEDDEYDVFTDPVVRSYSSYYDDEYNKFQKQLADIKFDIAYAEEHGDNPQQSKAELRNLERKIYNRAKYNLTLLDLLENKMDKSSKLNEDFYRWFQDSKVITETYEPKIVSLSENPKKVYGKGIYFDKEDNGSVKAYLQISNPFRLNEQYSISTFRPYIENIDILCNKQKISGKELFSLLIEAKYGIQLNKMIDTTIMLQNLGFDGIETKDKWIAFSKKQIQKL